MNRELWAKNLGLAVRALPRRSPSGSGRCNERALGDDSWGKWEIEDATIFNGVWLYSLLGYAEAMGEVGDLLERRRCAPTPSITSDLICPAGIVPDFGDAHWEANWPPFLVFFEAAAKAYADPAFKSGTARYRPQVRRLQGPDEYRPGLHVPRLRRWGTDAVEPDPPTGSREVMEDVQGKKIVFRNRLGARLHLPVPRLPRRGRRPEPRLPPRHDPGRGEVTTATPTRTRSPS